MGLSYLAIARRTKMYKEYFINNIDATSLDAGSGVAFSELTIRTDSDADFELLKRTHVATDNRIMVKFKDDGYGRNYQNSALDLRSISGAPLSNISAGDPNQMNGFLPFVLPRPVLIKGATTYTAELADFSGLANSVRLAMHGAKLRIGNAPWNESWRARPAYDYTTGRITLAANGTSSVNVSVNIDAHFLIHKITATRTGAALVTAKDGAADRQWMNVATHIDNFAGNAHHANILSAPRFVYKGSVVNFTLQDISGSSNVIQINLHGEKLFA